MPRIDSAPAVEFTLQIRPEFFEDVPCHIDSDLRVELRCSVARGAVVGIVSIGNGDRRGVPDDLGVIKSGAPGIVVGPENWAGSVSQPGPPAPPALTKVARVLVKRDWKYTFGHVIPNDQIAIGGAPISAEPGGALAEGTVCIRRQSVGSEDARKNDRPAVEGIFGSDSKFLAG